MIHERVVHAGDRSPRDSEHDADAEAVEHVDDQVGRAVDRVTPEELGQLRVECDRCVGHRVEHVDPEGKRYVGDLDGVAHADLVDWL